MQTVDQEPLKTPLYDLHCSLGGRMVGFAGYSLPVQYQGIVAEHLHTRQAASLFDVSHMGQVTVEAADFETAARGLEALLPGDLLGLKPGEMRYCVLLNDEGGIEDDLIVTRPAAADAPAGTLWIVVNAARKHHDLSVFESRLAPDLRFTLHEDRALLALQGPRAANVLSRFTSLGERLTFMQAGTTTIADIPVRVSRSGYTGEDGFEISVAADKAAPLANLLLADQNVKPAGLGARDSLRLEAGLCLYGHDMDEKTDPVTAGLAFTIAKRRRREGGFAGAAEVLAILREGPTKKRVGIRFEGRQPVREGAELVDESGCVLGGITSGTFSPSLEAPIAMGYLPIDEAYEGAEVTALVRGRQIRGEVVRMPFVPNRYVR